MNHPIAMHQTSESKNLIVDKKNKRFHNGKTAKMPQGSFGYMVTAIINGNKLYPSKRVRYLLMRAKGKNPTTKKGSALKLLRDMAHLAEYLENEHSAWFEEWDSFQVLLEIVKYRSMWVRSVEKWKPEATQNHDLRFRALVEHLFVLYPYPKCFEGIFFRREDYEFIPTFILLAQGGRLSQVELLTPLTHRMRVEFLVAPSGMSILETFKYAYVKGLGGDDLLARCLIDKLGNNRRYMVEAKDWEKFIKILVDGRMTDFGKIEELKRYYDYKKFRNPSLNDDNMTLDALIQQSDEWLEKCRKPNPVAKPVEEPKITQLITWTSAGFKPFEKTESEGDETYKMVEVLSNQELLEELKIIGFWFNQYSRTCSLGLTRIMSLRKYHLEGKMRLAIIEIDLVNRRIIKARNHAHLTISPKAYQLMQEWAEQEGLSINYYL